MRRAVCVLSIGAVVAALWSGIATAAVPLRFHTEPALLSQAIFRACFHEPDAPVALDESPLGVYALRVSIEELAAQSAPAITLARLTVPQLPEVQFATPVPLVQPSASYASAVDTASADQTVTLTPAQPAAPTFGYYRDAEPVPTIAPSSTRFDLPGSGGQSALSLSPVLTPAGFTGAERDNATSSVPQIASDVSVPVRLGHVHLQTHADAGQARSDALSYNDTAMGGGATFDARLGKWKSLGVDLSSHYEHLTVDQPVFGAASVDGTSNLELGNDHVPVFVPAYADISKHTISAGLAVPVSRRMTASLRVDEQHLLGGYGTPGLANLDANNMIYGARLTYQLKGTSAISLSAQQFRYQDNLIPANAFTTTSANLNFTVKF